VKSDSGEVAPWTSITWLINGEPIGQGRPRACVVNGHARLYTPRRSDAWCGRAVEVLACHWDGAPHADLATVVIDAVFSRPKRLLRRLDPVGRIPHSSKPDADNVAKAVLDAMVKAGVLRDDALVNELTVRKWYAARDEGPCVFVEMIFEAQQK
jgi:Holliday junction resolvase RusA-like endonuclease